MALHAEIGELLKGVELEPAVREALLRIASEVDRSAQIGSLHGVSEDNAAEYLRAAQ